MPLTPSEAEFIFHDRVVLSVEGVGRIECEAADEVMLSPPLVVPAGLLGLLAGHQGTVAVSRDDRGESVSDAGSLALQFRFGETVTTEPSAVTFGP